MSPAKVRENHFEGALDIPMRKYEPEQIVTMLRQIEVEIADGKTTPQARKEAEIPAQSHYRCRKECGGLKLDQANRLKELERENAKLEAFGGRTIPSEAELERRGIEKLLSPERRRCAVEQTRARYQSLGMKRIYMQYVSSPPKTLHVVGGYENFECLHCHEGARSFEEFSVHVAIMDSLESNQISCISNGCHDTVHDVAALSQVKFRRLTA